MLQAFKPHFIPVFVLLKTGWAGGRADRDRVGGIGARGDPGAAGGELGHPALLGAGLHLLHVHRVHDLLHGGLVVPRQPAHANHRILPLLPRPSRVPPPPTARRAAIPPC